LYTLCCHVRSILFIPFRLYLLCNFCMYSLQALRQSCSRRWAVRNMIALGEGKKSGPIYVTIYALSLSTIWDPLWFLSCHICVPTQTHMLLYLSQPTTRHILFHKHTPPKSRQSPPSWSQSHSFSTVLPWAASRLSISFLCFLSSFLIVCFFWVTRALLFFIAPNPVDQVISCSYGQKKELAF